MSTATHYAEIPELLSERQAANRLGISERTLAYQRRLGLIGFIKVGRNIRYTPKLIGEYLEKVTCKSAFKSASIGLAKLNPLPSGISRGTIRQHDKHDENLLALATLKLLKRNSRNGS